MGFGSFIKGGFFGLIPRAIYGAVKGGGSKNKAPSAPDYGTEMERVLQAQINLAPQLYANEAEYQPKYADLQSQIEAKTAQSQLGLYGALQPQYSQLENAYTTQQQQDQLKGLQERAPGYIQAFQQAQGTAGINQALQKYAENNLNQQMQAGFQLSPEEQRAINQQSLQPFAARGTALGNQADLASVLNRYQYAQTRKQQALQQASGIGSYLTQQSAPALASFYQQPMYAGAFGGQAVGNALAGQGAAGPALFNPESQTGMGSIYGAYNANMGLYGTQMQADAARKAGMMGMIGQIGGTAIGAAAMMCWVAREVYGAHNPDWLLFREWLTERAPKWFHDLYCKFGERFAAFIKNKPRLKAVIRKWMDSKISA
jgi:hypothetical protein